ncbi:MAG: hypothetical protein KKG76_04965 [Euryarchaeota archaeon]|nr:hypothetical protein [Euryarchaeota archaeon]MBU4139162.1 hypothetical protein [Euryarchaeota archaeon]
MNDEKGRTSLTEFISRRKFLIYLGIFLGMIIAGLNLLKKAGIKTVNRMLCSHI